MSAWLDTAIDRMYPPAADWVHRPSGGKDALFAAYEALSPKARAAYDADVLGAFRHAHGGDDVIAYRYRDRPTHMGGRSLSTVEPTWLGRDRYDAYRVRASDVLVHWAQEQMPLSSRAFGHEKEIVVRRDANPEKLPVGRAAGRKVARSCPPGLVGPFFHATTEARARKILKEGFTLDTFGERTGKGKGLWTPFGREKALPIYGLGIYVGLSREVAERYGTVVLSVYLRPDARILDSEWSKMTARRPRGDTPGTRAREPRWWQEFLEFVAEDANERGGGFMNPAYVDRLEQEYGRPLTPVAMRRYFDKSAVLPWVIGNHQLPLDWDTLVSYAGRLARARGYAAVEWDGELTVVDLSAVACVERTPEREPEPEPLPSNVIPFRRPGSAGGRAVAKKLDPKLWEASKKKAIARMGGVFSARAMQLAVHLYKKAGGRYAGSKTGREGLSKWTAEKWRTRPGTSRIATHGDTTARYLPEKAWAKLSPAERRATDAKKRRACRGVKGACFIPNTLKARRAGIAARHGRSSGHASPDFAELRALEKAMERKYKGVTVIFGQDDRHIIWGLLEVSRRKQRQGLGSAVVREVVDYARAHGLGIRGTPGRRGELSSTTSRSAVVRFWMRQGFVESDGRDGYQEGEVYIRPVDIIAAVPSDAREAARGLSSGSEVDGAYYMEEGCAYVAIALHRTLRLRVAALVDEENRWSRTLPSVAHVFAVDDAGMGYDIEGPKTVEQMRQRWFDLLKPRIILLTEEELRRRFMGSRKPLHAYSAAEVRDAYAALARSPYWSSKIQVKLTRSKG